MPFIRRFDRIVDCGCESKNVMRCQWFNGYSRNPHSSLCYDYPPVGIGPVEPFKCSRRHSAWQHKSTSVYANVFMCADRRQCTTTAAGKRLQKKKRPGKQCSNDITMKYNLIVKMFEKIYFGPAMDIIYNARRTLATFQNNSQFSFLYYFSPVRIRFEFIYLAVRRLFISLSVYFRIFVYYLDFIRYLRECDLIELDFHCDRIAKL